MASPAVDVHLLKPLLRGRIHLAALVASIPAVAALIAASHGVEAKVAASAYGATLVLLFGASSAYHRVGDRAALQWLRRLDHSSIYLLIAGSYTPVCLVALRGWWSGALLVGVWITAAIGVVLKLLRFERSHRLGFVLYLTMGWAVLSAGPALLRSVEGSTLLLLVAGGVLYTVGAVVLATRFPNPFPRFFGYHEVWHLMVVVAAGLHYVAIRGVVTSV